MKRNQIVVVGGGLAGLYAAVRVARAGASVTLLERSHVLGGRAASQNEAECTLNQGPHALYLGGAAVRLLREMEIPWKGARSKSPYSFAEFGGKAYPLPTGALAQLRSRLLGVGGKVQLARARAKLSEDEGLEATPLCDWIAQVRDPRGRAVLAALFRVATYCADHELFSAAAAMRQLRLALDPGVAYLDQGWQSLVDGLAERARDAGVAIRTSSAPVRIERDGRGFSVHLPDADPHLRADAVVLAVGPNACAQLVPESASLTRAAAEAVPVRAACLDVALNRLPNERHHFTLGIDTPDYLSVHSAFARLAPERGAVIHVARYLKDGAEDPTQVRAELEALLERSQPGWRSHASYTRFLPKMTVYHDMPRASARGVRTAVAVADIPNLFVAGDWVGDEGLLLDAALASACRAADLALRAPIRDSIRDKGVALRDMA